jgi:hypothetical protein
MKRSKVFLALSGAVLAIVGVASARAHYSPAKTGFYSIGLGSCTNASTLVGFTKASAPSPKLLVTKENGVNRQIYTAKTITPCVSKPLYTKQGE